MGLFACLLTVALLSSFVYSTGPTAADKLHVMQKYNVYAVAFWPGVFITAFALFLNG